jgi:hypothetical protein
VDPAGHQELSQTFPSDGDEINIAYFNERANGAEILEVDGEMSWGPAVLMLRLEANGIIHPAMRSFPVLRRAS